MKKYDSYKDSGIEWVGEIPGHWEVKRLSWCFEIIGSGTTPKAGPESHSSITGKKYHRQRIRPVQSKVPEQLADHHHPYTEYHSASWQALEQGDQ
ncbi:hypothetical protein [Nitritalea halalkaliphila]|uniref:hypothetical protein n=1 Tax=Nitritalea halalkaliphila TaxID=590849 RepID=UPI001EE64883|nr:hypothetical protein [Nitritalea halalkaliphila]